MFSKGDEISWKWGSQHPSGPVKEVKDDGAQVKTKKGSTISKDASKDNPAIVIETASGNNAVKKVSFTFVALRRRLKRQRLCLTTVPTILSPFSICRLVKWMVLSLKLPSPFSPTYP